MLNKLPSEVAQNATTFDIMVLDVYTTWEKHKTNPTDQTQYNVDNLQEILRRTR